MTLARIKTTSGWVDLSKIGPKGDKGDKGDVGATGPPGATGGQGLPTGGATGRVLTKQSSANYDAVWTSPSNLAQPSSYYVDHNEYLGPVGAATLLTAATWKALTVPASLGTNNALPLDAVSYTGGTEIRLKYPGMWIIVVDVTTGVLPSAGTNDVSLGISDWSYGTQPMKFGGFTIPGLPASSTARLQVSGMLKADQPGDNPFTVSARCSRAVTTGGFQILGIHLQRTGNVA